MGLNTDVPEGLHPVIHEAKMVGESVLAIPKGQANRAQVGQGCFLIGFEQGVALALAYPDRAREILDLIDDHVLEARPEDTRIDRARYLDHLVHGEHH